MEWKITKQYDGMMLRDYLFDVLHFSNRLVKKAKETESNILVNGERKTVRYIVKSGDILTIELKAEKISDSIIPENIPLQMVYEDDFFMIINKKANMPTIPSRLHQTGTIANGLRYYYEKNNIPSTVHIVTRLDKDTSGLVLIAKHQYSHSLFSNLQRKNELKRKYTAIVHGRLAKKQDMIDEPIGRNPHSIIERMVTSEGKKAVTRYEVVKETKQFSVVEIELETGRTHQIRVHFSFIGHPLVGDDLYGGSKKIIGRQALHCSEISFVHPVLKKEMRFSSKLASDIAMIFTSL
ncbi:RluA family pseudouridine synthase [Pseudogracilibacillus auburnensis]|uniref:Pseudouridine synthase n=1 Tax=Pseudogracilibacillus auburnensis TaxID=1494959 RepID=A0A2V3VZL3_9BACI|nr:RluA family pseudouridine synthase [Pseudogracilibacillus auburnensis]PXW87070.1 RluA family pseudouridine synthase [Pseudogracilibacillus auburnensis]